MLGKKANARDTTAYRIVSRVVAGEIEKWIRRDLVGPQDVLVDLPHLLMRMPFLLGMNAGQLTRWNEAIAAMKPPYGMAAEIYDNDLKLDTFAGRRYMDEVTLFLVESIEIERSVESDVLRRRRGMDRRGLLRRSLPIQVVKQRIGQQAIGFATELEGPWNRRHVAYIKGQYAYMPMSRFAK